MSRRILKMSRQFGDDLYALNDQNKLDVIECLEDIQTTPTAMMPIGVLLPNGVRQIDNPIYPINTHYVRWHPPTRELRSCQ